MRGSGLTGRGGLLWPQLAGWPDALNPLLGPFFPGLEARFSEGDRHGSPGAPHRGQEVETRYHESVLLDEVVHYLQPTRGKRFLDGTVGGGGHSERLLEAGAEVLGLDQDPDALAYARRRLEGHTDCCALIQANFSDFPDILTTTGLGKLDGILVDLGVSSRQLENGERGFSFMKPGPLDMRMDPGLELTAGYLVNHSDEEELTYLFKTYGEEPAAARIAKAIVRARMDEEITRTDQLAAIIEKASPRRGKKTHPATRVFQALRIAVNDEMHSLEVLLDSAIEWLKPGGRLVVISFHSLEDRIVKRFLQHHTRRELDRPEWPAPKPNPDYHFDYVLKKALRPSEEEVKRNPRARSARMRVAERIAHG
ncbi:MAG: 16S rRNA (cytosine(1402)-N(4))-methyltransferase RsmH [Verrucomicrobiota bacterium]